MGSTPNFGEVVNMQGDIAGRKFGQIMNKAKSSHKSWHKKKQTAVLKSEIIKKSQPDHGPVRI